MDPDVLKMFTYFDKVITAQECQTFDYHCGKKLLELSKLLLQDVNLRAGQHPRHSDGLHDNEGMADGAGALRGGVRALGAALLHHGARHLHHHQGADGEMPQDHTTWDTNYCIQGDPSLAKTSR